MLQAIDIEKRFGTYKALEKVNIDVRENTIFGLLGPNGAGKTTLIRIVNHIIAPDAGELRLDGRTMTDVDVAKIGYLPEERGLYKKMKVGEQSIYLAQLKGLSKTEATRRLHEWFERFEIGGWWNRRVEELSKGMQQKVQFIVTVLHNPKLLIFDEPFSGFDPVNAELLKREILRLRDEGATVIFSTHNMASVEELCDDIALIDRSHVVLSGGIRDVRSSYRSNLCRVECVDADSGLSLPDGFEVRRKVLANDKVTMDVKLPNSATSNDLIALLLSQCTIASLNEILPSMNEIFIHTVEKNGR